MGKVFARQIVPEIQDYDFDGYDWSGIAIVGNRELESYKDDRFDDVCFALTDFFGNENNIGIEVLNECFDYIGKAFSKEEYERIMEIGCDYDKDGFCEILSMVLGGNWQWRTINGSAQSEWNYLFYDNNIIPYMYTDELEILYFNLGTEWEVMRTDDDIEIGNAYDVCGYNVYCMSDDDSEVKEDIRKQLNCPEDEVILFKFSGYKKIAKYEMV